MSSLSRTDFRNPRKPRKPSPETGEARLRDLTTRYTVLHAAYSRLVAGLPERDRQVRDAAIAATAATAEDAIRVGLSRRDEATTERVVGELREAGFLRERPAKPTNVRHVIRNAAGAIEGLYDVIEQVEPEGPSSVA